MTYWCVDLCEYVPTFFEQWIEVAVGRNCCLAIYLHTIARCSCHVGGKDDRDGRELCSCFPFRRSASIWSTVASRDWAHWRYEPCIFFGPLPWEVFCVEGRVEGHARVDGDDFPFLDCTLQYNHVNVCVLSLFLVFAKWISCGPHALFHSQSLRGSLLRWGPPPGEVRLQEVDAQAHSSDWCYSCKRAKLHTVLPVRLIDCHVLTHTSCSSLNSQTNQRTYLMLFRACH